MVCSAWGGPETAPVVEEGGAAAATLLDEGLHFLGGAREGGAGQDLGGQTGPRVFGFDREDVSPVHAGGFEFPGPHVEAQRRLADAVQVGGKPGMDLGVVEPLARVAVNLGGGGLKHQHVPPVLQGGDVAVERLPVVADDDDLLA